MGVQHYLSFQDLAPARSAAVVAAALARKRGKGPADLPLQGKSLALLFLKPSTRTRISFEAGMAQLGGATLALAPDATQLARGESVSDTAKIIGSMCDAVAIRVAEHEVLQEFAAASAAPVINALTVLEHPCQVLADVMTFIELRGDIAGRRIAWVGDCNNVCRSWMRAAADFGFELAVACPESYRDNSEAYGKLPAVAYASSPAAAVEGAACVVTDVWHSMGDDEQSKERRLRAFADYTVTAALMAQADKDAIFMHCLPAHRGEEVAAEVIDGESSAVWVEAENRMHVQKALLLELLKEA